MAIQGYVTAQEIVDFMTMINPLFVQADINELLVNAMYDFINAKVGENYEVEELTMYLDGTGDIFVYSEKMPIVNVKRIAVVGTDGVLSDLKILGADRNVWWDDRTGRIWREVVEGDITLDEDDEDTLKFPDRPDCVMVEGSFGSVVTSLVKQIQLLMILKNYALMKPSDYATDIVEEKIGRYAYKLSSASNLTPENQRKGLDGWLAYLMEQLPKINSMALESI